MDLSTALLAAPTDTDEPEAEELLDPLGRSAEMADEEQLERCEALRNWLAGGGRGVLVPDLAFQVAGERVLVCAVRSLAHGARLAPIAQAATTGEPIHFVGEACALAPLHAVGVNTIAASKFDLRTIAAALQASRTGLDSPQLAPRSA